MQGTSIDTALLQSLRDETLDARPGESTVSICLYCGDYPTGYFTEANIIEP